MPTNAIALSRLLIAERSSLVRWVMRIVGSELVAGDVAQSLYLRVQTVEDHPPIITERSFLFRLASLDIAGRLQGEERDTVLALWRQRGKRAFEAETEARKE